MVVILVKMAKTCIRDLVFQSAFVGVREIQRRIPSVFVFFQVFFNTATRELVFVFDFPRVNDLVFGDSPVQAVEHRALVRIHYAGRRMHRAVRTFE